MKCLIFDLFHLYEKVKGEVSPVDSALNLIKKLEEEEKSTHTIVVKSDISRSWRSNLGFGYKNPTSKIGLSDSMLIAKIIKRMGEDGIRVEGYVGMEASDLFSTISSKMTTKKDAEIIGYTEDIKAFFSISQHVTIKSLLTNKTKTHEWIEGKFVNTDLMKMYYASVGVNTLHLKPAVSHSSKKSVLENIQVSAGDFYQNPESAPIELRRNYKILGTMKNLELGFKLSDIAR